MFAYTERHTELKRLYAGLLGRRPEGVGGVRALKESDTPAGRGEPYHIGRQCASLAVMRANDILSTAADLMAERSKQYDTREGERSMARTVEAFNAITGHRLTEADGFLLLQVLKDVRDRQRDEPHRDSLFDGVAYAALKAEARLRE